MVMRKVCLAILLSLGTDTASFCTEREAKSPEAFLPTGSLVRVVTLTKIFSFNQDVIVIAQLDGPATFREREVLPDKTKLLGKALILKSNDRVNVSFDRAIFPDGKELEISGIALSPDGSMGIQGTVKKHGRESLVTSAALRGAIQGTASAAGAVGANPIAAEAGQAVAQEAINQIDLSREQVDTSITVPAYTRCLVYLAKRLEIQEAGQERPR